MNQAGFLEKIYSFLHKDEDTLSIAQWGKDEICITDKEGNFHSITIKTVNNSK